MSYKKPQRDEQEGRLCVKLGSWGGHHGDKLLLLCLAQALFPITVV